MRRKERRGKLFSESGNNLIVERLNRAINFRSKKQQFQDKIQPEWKRIATLFTHFNGSQNNLRRNFRSVEIFKDFLRSNDSLGVTVNSSRIFLKTIAKCSERKQKMCN